MIRRIIEVRSVLEEHRQRGLSWDTLAGLLEQEKIHITAGTLRNYMRMIRQAEARLQEKSDQAVPKDEDIHKALYACSADLPKPAVQSSPVLQARVYPSAPPGVQIADSLAGPPRATTSLIRNTSRDL